MYVCINMNVHESMQIKDLEPTYWSVYSGFVFGW